MSSLLEPESSFTQSTTVESTTTNQSHGKKWRAPVWLLCRRPTEDEDQDLLYCPHCPLDSDKPLYSTDKSENMKKHLIGQHQVLVPKKVSKSQEVVQQQLKQYYQQAEANDDTAEFDSEILRSYLHKAVITEALISLIVVRNLSFCLAEWPEFYTLCQALNRESEGIITTCHSSIYNQVCKAWGRHKDVVRRELQAALSRIHISLDI